jgi:hypothetical protein
MIEEEILNNETSQITERRRTLLPIWVKIFLWIFMIFGAVAPIGLILGIFGMSFDLSLYGLETTNPLSLVGLIIIALFAIKGAVSFGLWTEKDWAIKLAIIDSILGIAICVLVMIVLPFLYNNGFKLTLRLELVALIPYLLKMQTIKSDWESRN